MKHMIWISGLFVAVLLISNTVSTKILDFGPFSFDGGTILFPIAYILGDVLTEVYGFRQAKKIIWLGFICLALMAGTYAIVGLLPPAIGWENQESYQAILGFVPRIAIASLVGYLAGSFSNSYVLEKMKAWTKGRMLWTRTIGSTIIGEGIDTFAFVLIAFAGTMTTGLLWSIIISNYIFKVLVEVIFTPITYLVVARLKHDEKSL
jgi:queuosine precursor transporter